MADFFLVSEVGSASKVDVWVLTVDEWVWVFQNWGGGNALASFGLKCLFHICNVYK